MSKGIIKEKKPQKLSRWEVLKAWIAESIASIKRNLKDGGWKGTMLTLSSATAAAIAPTVLTACVNEPDVKIETITDKEKVESLVSENFSVENAVKDEMQKQFGKLENFTFENGVAKAVVTKDGEKYNAEATINVDVNDFKVEKYNNAEVADDGSLHFYLDGKLTSEKVDGIVVEVGKDIYVIDPTDFYNEISMAVSDASLNKVETEKPDPEEPENPGGEDKPAPEEPENPDPEEPENPENPTDPENPDPDEPENPGGEDKPDPDEPENPGGEENPDPENPENPTDPENPDPEEPENPGDEGGTVEIKYEEYQNFDEFVLDLEGENLDAFKTAVSEALRNGFTTSNWLSLFGRGTTLENTKTYQFAFNFDNSGNIESVQYVAIKNDITISKGTVTFTTPISIENLKKATYSGDVEEIVENGELVGIRYVENNEQKDVRPTENQMLIKESDGTYSLIDYTDFISSISQDNISTVVGNFSQASPGELTETNQSYFDLCMPLAVEAGVIDANATLGFVSVQGRGSTNAEWGTTHNITIRCADLTTNEYYNLGFVFDDEQDRDTLLERLQSAIDRGNYRVTGGQENTIITGDQIFEFEEALDGVVTYTISAENQK